MKINDTKRINFYHGTILYMDQKMDTAFKAREVFFGRSRRTPKLFRRAIDAAIRAEGRRGP